MHGRPFTLMYYTHGLPGNVAKRIIPFLTKHKIVIFYNEIEFITAFFISIF